MDLLEARAYQYHVASRHPWERARLTLATELIRTHVGLVSGDVVLDVGCGDTFVAEGLARANPGVRFAAVDNAFTDELLQQFRARVTVPNVDIYKSLDDVPVARPASLVLLMDVVEHVPDDVAFLREVCGRPSVSAQAAVLITVPAYQRLFCSHDRALGHYRRYSRRTLRSSITAAGLVPIEQGNLFASLVPLRIAQVLRERARPPAEVASQLTAWGGSETIGRALETLLTLDGRTCLALGRAGIWPPGLSTFAICRKSA